MNSAVYAIGFLLIVIGIIYLAHLMHIPQTYIVAGTVILVGMGILTGIQQTRGK